MLGLYMMYKISQVEGWTAPCLVVLLFLLLDIEADRRNDVSWQRFLPWGLLALGVPYFIYRRAPTLWWGIARWQFESAQARINLNHLMQAIPFNDAHFIWAHRIPGLGAWIGWSYGWGFALVLWVCVIRSFFARDARKMARYALAGHILQTPLIMPFFWVINVQEVWFVLGHPDRLGRTWPTLNDQLVEMMNCFPSMHTSIAFAMLLLALREKGRLFKWGTVIFSSSIIYSTMYMEIHWIIDVFAGMLFAWGVVKLTDWILAKVWPELTEWKGGSPPLPPIPRRWRTRDI